MGVLIEFLGEEPFRAHEGDAGADLELKWNASIVPGAFAKLELATRVSIPEGFFGLLSLRSSMAVRGLIGHVGVIDSGYTGPLSVVAGNISGERQVLWAGERVAQLVVVPLPGVEFVRAEVLSSSTRGVGGFGSTGTGVRS